MYNILPETKGNNIAIRVQGYMNSQDIKTLLPYLKHRIEQHGRIRILVELRNVNGIEMLAILRTLPFSFKYSKRVEKKAVVTDERWVYTWANLLSPLSKTQVRCFPNKDMEKAWDWVRK
jgi:hypothetical protein